MGAIELQIDRYADEQGRLDAIEAYVEREWDKTRDELADKLANGERLEADERVVLDFGDVNDRLWSNYPERGEAAMKLCAQTPSLGGRHMQKLLFEIAQELVDSFADAFKKDLETDDEH